jgi:NAD(P) transhydrogenase
MAPSTPLIAASFLGASTILSFLKGYTTTAAIGGADMRTSGSLIYMESELTKISAVVITVLNAYSWVLSLASMIWTHIF